MEKVKKSEPTIVAWKKKIESNLSHNSWATVIRQWWDAKVNTTNMVFKREIIQEVHWKHTISNYHDGWVEQV